MLNILPFFFILSPLYPNTAYRIGERLSYDVKVLGISVAKLEIEVVEETVYNNISAYRVITDIETLPWLTPIYHLHNRFNSYIEKETLLPIRIERKAKEGSWTNTIIINIDQQNRILYYKDSYGQFNANFKGQLFGLDSLLFYPRGINLIPGEIKKLTIYVGKNIIHVDAKVLEKPIKLKVDCLNKRSPLETLKIQQLGNEEAAVWYTNDKLRIPVRILAIAIKIVGWRIITFEANLLKYESRN